MVGMPIGRAAPLALGIYAPLFKALYLAVTEASKRWTVRTRNWSEIMAQLSVFFQDRLRDSFR
jgi:hypothetical protein